MQIFFMFDTDQSGSIKASDIDLVLIGFGVQYDKAEMAANLDGITQSGNIDFSGFLSLMAGTICGDRAEEAKAVFNHMDADGSGAVSKVELRHIMANTGETIPNEEVDRMLEAADQDGLSRTMIPAQRLSLLCCRWRANRNR